MANFINRESVNLTELETKFMEAFIGDLYAEPGFSDINLKDMVKATGIPMRRIKGVLGSLVNKGIVWTMSDVELGIPRSEGVGEIIYLSSNYENLHSEWAQYINE